MGKSKCKENGKIDRIEGNRIIIHDNPSHKSKVIKKVEIILPHGGKKFYKIIRTSNGGYLFNR